MNEQQAMRAAIDRMGYASDERPEECVAVRYGDGHSGRGWYAWSRLYPEEGSVFIGRDLPRLFRGGAIGMGLTSLAGFAMAWHTGDSVPFVSAAFAAGYAVAMSWAWSQVWPDTSPDTSKVNEGDRG